MSLFAKISLFFIFFFSSINSYAQSDDDFADFFEVDSSISDDNIKKARLNNDPLENINRKIFKFNDYLDEKLLLPIATSYRNYTPKIIKSSFRNFLKNIKLPFSFINSFLQGKIENSSAISSTFLINSTIGIAGIIDIAGNKYIKYNVEDFGQTLAYYNFPQGPYIVLPFFGPSNIRDLSGLVIEKLINPFDVNKFDIASKSNIITDNVKLTINSISLIDKRESLIDIISDIKVDSFDFYSTIKSSYIQNRNFEINR